MMMMLWWGLTAYACPPTETRIESAQLAFDNADLDDAQDRVDGALNELVCQERVVPPETLLRLYRLDGLIDLALGDEKAAIESVLRALAVDPLSAPPAAFGPELARLHRSWSGRASAERSTVGVRGGGRVHIDGQALSHGQQVDLVSGVHLVQVERDGSLTNYLDTIESDKTIGTGLPVERAVAAGPEALPEPDWTPPEVQKRRRPLGLIVAGAAALVAGSATAIWSQQQERAFHQRAYTDPAAVDRDAIRIRAGYLTGYGLIGGGTAVMAAVAIGLPPRRKR